MVFQNSIPFCAPSQRRLHMIAGPDDTAYLAVLNQFNEPQGNLHHMLVPIAEISTLANTGEGSVTAKGENATITISKGDHEAHYDFGVICEDIGEHVRTETEVERSDFEALLATLQVPTPS